MSHNRTTYNVGLLQAKSYRILKNHLTECLSKYDISAIEWALVGLLYDHREGMRSSTVAKELGVEASFITALFSTLKNRELVNIKSDATDSRVKIIYVTPQGIEFVEEVEPQVHAQMEYVTQGISPQEHISYINVLEYIVEKTEKTHTLIN